MVSQGKEPSRVGVTGTLGRLFQHLSVPVIAVLIFVFQGPKGYVLNLDGRLFNAGTSVDGLWLFRWLEHALSSPGVSVWDPPVFHPLKGALALGEPMLGNLLIYAPVKILSGNPILALNMVALGSFVLGAFAVYLLARGISGSYWAGLAAGLLFAFNPAQWYIIPGLRQGAFCWAALALYFLDRHVRSGKSRHLWGVAVAFSLQLWTSISLGGALAALLVLMLVHHLAFHGRRSGPFHARFWVNLTGSVVLAAVALLPLLVPYFGADAVSAKEMLSPRGGPLALLLPAADSVTAPGTFFRNYAWLHDMVGGGEGGLFPGLVLPILFCILFCLLIWQVLSRRRKGTYSARCTQRYRVQLSEFVDGAKRNRTNKQLPITAKENRHDYTRNHYNRRSRVSGPGH